MSFIRRRFDYLVPLLVALFSVFVAYNNVGTGIINYSDHKFPFDFHRLFINQLFVWNDNIFLGFNQSLSLSLNLSYTALFALIQSFISNYVFVNRLEYILAIFCNFYFTYLFLTSIFPNKLRNIQKLGLLLCSSFFFSNALSAGLFYMGVSQQIFAFSFVPLALFGLRKYFVTNRKSWLLLVAIACLFIASVNLPYGFIAIGAVLLVIFSFSDWSRQLKIKYTFIFMGLFMLLNTYWFSPFFYSAFISPPKLFFESISSKSNDGAFADYLKYISSRYSMDQLFKLAPDFDLIKTQNEDNSPLVDYYAERYITAISYLAIIFVLGYGFFVRKAKNEIRLNKLVLAAIFLIFLFFAKGQNKPLAEIYSFLLSKSVFFKIFRDSMKWMIIPYLIFIISAADILVNSNSKAIKILISLFFFAYLFPWVSGGLMGKLRAYDVPEYYFQLAKSYEKTERISDKRAVILDSQVGPMDYQFDKRNLMPLSSNILKFISPLPTVDLFSNGGGIAVGYLTGFYERLNKDDSDLREFQKIGATHIYHQRDIKNSAEYDYTDKYFEKKSFGLIDEYEIKKDYVMSKIFLAENKNQSDVYFSKISPSQYKIKIKNLKSSAVINFLYTFDDNWSLYLEKTNDRWSCDAFEKYQLTHLNNIYSGSDVDGSVFECRSAEGGFNLADSGYLFKSSVFDKDHYLINNYSNAWKMDSEYIKQNFDKSYYKENPDGSIEVELTLYFKPQSYFYFGLLISGATLLACLGYLIYDWRKRRKVEVDRKTL